MKKKADVRRIVFVGMLILSFTFMLISVSFSWFSHGREAEYSGFGSTTSSVYHIMARSSDTGWGYDVKCNLDAELSPITGNGLVFFKPNFSSSTSTLGRKSYVDGNGLIYHKPELTSFTKIQETQLENYAFVLDVQLESQNATLLYLSSLTFLQPQNSSGVASSGVESSGVESSGVESSGVESSGVESSGVKPEPVPIPSDVLDMGAGALRMAILQQMRDGSYALRYVFIPNPDYELQKTPSGGWAASYTGAPETTYEFRTEAALTSTKTLKLKPADYPEGYCVIDDVVYIFRMPEDESLPSTLMLSPGENNLLRLIVWLEGTDRECQNPISGSNILLNMQLTTKESMGEE